MESNENPYTAPGSEVARALATQRHYGPASGTQRLVNYLVDCIFAIVALCAVTFVSAVLAPERTLAVMNDPVLSQVASLGAIFAYYVLLEGMTGRTLGKMLTSTKVIGEHGGQPGLMRILLRSLIRFFPLDGLSFLNSNPQGLHDLWSKTRVVRLAPSKLQRAMDDV